MRSGPSIRPMSSVGRVLAVDLGGTRVKVAEVDVTSEPAQVGEVRSVPAPGDLAGALDVLASVISSAPADCQGIGLAVPGLVRADGVIQALPGKYDGIVGFDLQGWLRTQRDLPAVVLNDAIAYGIGEAVCGAGRGAERVVVVTIGTGFGVTVVDQGRPISTGPLGGGILGGFVPISDAEGPTDTAGMQGTIEARCRADRIVDYARDAGLEVSDVRGVYAAAASGDERAIAASEVYREWLARGITALAVAHGADRVVVGGGPATADAPWFAGLQELVLPRLWPSHELTVARSELGDSAAALGLAHAVRVRSGTLNS